MDKQPASEVELAAVQLLNKQRRNNKLISKVGKMKFNSLVILIFPMMLILLDVILKSYGLEIDIFFYGLWGFFILLFMFLNEKVELLYKLFMSEIENKSELNDDEKK